MNAEAWEPWRLEVGQRVRVRLSAECRAELHEARPAPSVSDDEVRDLMRRGADVATMFAGAGQRVSHPECMDGVTGEITSVYRDEAARGHYYRVMFDQTIEPGAYIGADFAAIELEPMA